MHVEDVVLFLSMKPRFAESILGGTKTVELRRVPPAVQEGHLVLLYASSPRRELVGTCRVAGLEVDSTSVIWDRHGRQSGITKSEYERYFAGAKRAVAILIKEPSPLSDPKPLRDSRGAVAGFHPPQSFRYFDRSTVERLRLVL